MPGKPQIVDLRFPLGGLHRRSGYQQQQPYTTPDCLNVWPSDVFGERLRGGSRPGLAKAFTQQLGSGLSVRMLANVDIVRGDGFSYWTDEFDGHEIAAAWSFATWLGTVPSVVGPGVGISSTSFTPEAGLVRFDFGSSFDTAQPYVVEILIAPYNGEHWGHYQLFLRMDNTTPDAELNGVVVDLYVTGATGAYSGTAKVYVAGVPTTYTMTSGTIGSTKAGWLRALVSGNTLTVTWQETTILTQVISAAAGRRMGFGMNCTEVAGVCLVDTFRTQYYTTPVSERVRRILVASAGGSLYKETYQGTLAQVSTALTIAPDRLIHASQRSQKLYIADHADPLATGSGTISFNVITAAAMTAAEAALINAGLNDIVAVIYNGTGQTIAGNYAITSAAIGGFTLSSFAADSTGGCSYRIERVPKVYDPIADTLTNLTAGTDLGQVPTSCPCIAVWRDRLVLAGGLYSPNIWYMSRQGDPTDWDYGADDTDVQRAVAGNTALAGQVGEPIVAVVPHTDDYLVFGCRTSLWVLRGDPAYGGTINQLSQEIGIVGRGAWCRGPNAELVFLSRDGLYMLGPGADSFPESISREKLPQELRDVDPEMHTAMLAYDTQNRGVHIFVSGFLLRNRYHYFFHWETKSFWPVSLYDSHEPFSLLAYNAADASSAAVILGCYDGYIRRFRLSMPNDDGQSFTSYVTYGPIRLGNSDYRDGQVRELSATLGAESGSVTWGLYAGDGHETAVRDTTANATGTWDRQSLNKKNRPRVRGASALLKVTGDGLPWTMERLTMVRTEMGTLRV